MAHPGGRPLKFKSPEDLEEMIAGYFTDCDENERPYTITGLALWLDTSRETLLDYQERPEFSDAIKRAKVKCENWVEENALMNKVNPTTAIFNLKNNYGWKDKVEQDITSDGKALPQPLLYNVLTDNKPQEDSEPE